MSRFAPVRLPEPLGDRASQTMLRHFNACPRSGYLYALTRGQVRTVEMMRGAAGHAILERSTRAMMEEGEAAIPGEIVKLFVDDVLSDPAFPVPLEEHDYLREAAYRWAAETAVDASSVVAVETLFSLDVDGFQVRVKIDFAELLEDGAAVHVVDYKTGRGAPSFEDIARKLPDGRLMAKNFQLCLYALVLAFGVPVRVEECLTCQDSPGWTAACPVCKGARRIEIPEPFPVASHAQRFDLEYVYPGIEDREGKMLRRPVTLTRAELVQYRASLEGLVARVRAAEMSGDWPAVVSDSACGECPASSMCPIPAELRDHRGSINTSEQAAEALEVRFREKAEQRARTRELREFVKHAGPVRYGNGRVAEIGYSASEQIRDKAGFMDAVERTARYGEPLERHRFVKTVESFPLVERELTADELAEEVEDGNERNGDGGADRGSGEDRDQSLDERYGSEAPF
jgi:hypothetical protein